MTAGLLFCTELLSVTVWLAVVSDDFIVNVTVPEEGRSDKEGAASNVREQQEWSST
jgi:hypothetical protein|tara:strand:+ start:319 stop:486 length:168 start_codon:yes stop_codon:yes gene_type:complete